MDKSVIFMNLSMAGLQHRIQTFDFVPGKTPLAGFNSVVGAVAMYLLVC
jgi:hypothetical protein